MSKSMNIEIFNIEEDGLPNMGDPNMTGRVAFIWDGCIISGWPIGEEHGGINYGEQLWEPAEDRFGGPVAGVKHWVLAPTPHWKIEDNND